MRDAVKEDLYFEFNWFGQTYKIPVGSQYHDILESLFVRLVDGSGNVLATSTGTTLVTGDVWKVTVDATAYTHTIAAGERLADVLNDLAAQIDAAAGYAARVEGNAIAVSKVGGGSPAVSVQVPSYGATASVDSTGAKTSAVTLTGTPSNGETWTVTVDGTAYSHVVAGQNLNGVITSLAARIDAAQGYSAGVENGKIIVTRLDGQPVSVSHTITPVTTLDSTTARTTRVTVIGTPSSIGLLDPVPEWCRVRISGAVRRLSGVLHKPGQPGQRRRRLPRLRWTGTACSSPGWTEQLRCHRQHRRHTGRYSTWWGGPRTLR